MKTGSVFSGFGRILNTSKTAGRQWDTIRHDACPQVYRLVDAMLELAQIQAGTAAWSLGTVGNMVS